MGDVADLTAKAYEIARMIPQGHVTTYGQSLLLIHR
jgi:alkylated DNA nucleotide flippase Atl1